MSEVLRIDKILTDTGHWSRKESKKLIRSGAVRVNGAVVKAPEKKFSTENLSLQVCGESVAWKRFTYIMLHKPAGVLTATEDRRQPTVLDLLPEELQKRGLVPVGRLDKDTEGLLLLTNDGELTHRLLAPKSHVDKVYYARTAGTVDESDILAFEAGMTLPDGSVCQSAGLKKVGEGECLVTLREGKFHQVKRMLSARGKEVTYLKRLSMGTLKLDENLQKGEYRELSSLELENLLQVKEISEKRVRQNKQKNRKKLLKL